MARGIVLNGELNGSHAAIASKYFKMGAVVALGELLNEKDFAATKDQRVAIRRYLASFGVVGMQDAEELGVTGVYKYSFENLYAR